MKIKLIAAFFAFSMLATMNADAQVKIGFTNIDFILSNLPDSKDIQTKLSTEKAQYDKLLQEKIADFQSSYEDYQKNAATMTPLIRQDKEKTLQVAQESIQAFQQQSESALQAKQQELLAPVMDKIQKSIDVVAKAKGYTHVFNSDAGFGTTPVILVAPETDNITNLVFEDLGVPVPTPAAAAAPAGN